MKLAHSNQEIEIKLHVADISALHRKLKQLKARKICSRTCESNTLYDDAKKSLSARGQLLRVRINQPAPIGAQKRLADVGNAIITYKGPARSPSRVGSAPTAKSRYKIKEEVEVDFGSLLGNNERAADQMKRILHAIGLRPVFQYEKFRTTYVLPRIANLKVELDETPIGTYLELEGTESGIDRAAKLLGYTQQDYITQSYGVLYISFCRSRGSRPGNMLFAATKKLR